MYQKIKQLADEALALQNKDRMDAVLREISAMCGKADEAQPDPVIEQAVVASGAEAGDTVAVTGVATETGKAVTATAKVVKKGAK